MDQIPEKLPREVRDPHTQTWRAGWEDVTSKKFKNNVDAYFNSFRETLLENGINLDETTKILEVGHGDGIFIQFAKSQGVNIVGVDVYPRGKVDSQVAARIEQLPFKDESFDAVYSAWTLDFSVYNNYPEKMLEEIARVLKKGGIYFPTEDFSLASFPRVPGSLKKQFQYGRDGYFIKK